MVDLKKILGGALMGAGALWLVRQVLAKRPGLPTEYQKILDNYSVECHVYDKINTIPQINPRHENVRILTYHPGVEHKDVDGTVMYKTEDVYVLGVEDTNIKDGQGRYRPGDDYKELIVSIRKVTDYRQDPTWTGYWITFQPSFAHMVVYDQTTGEQVYETYTDATDNTLAHALPHTLLVLPLRT